MRHYTLNEKEAYISSFARVYRYAVYVWDVLGRKHDLTDMGAGQALVQKDLVKRVSISESVDAPSMECEVTCQLSYETLTLAYGGDVGVVENDCKVEVWSSLAVESSDSTQTWSPIKVFEGRVVDLDSGGSELKFVARDSTHDLTQAFIVPGTNLGTGEIQGPPPGGSEEEQVFGS